MKFPQGSKSAKFKQPALETLHSKQSRCNVNVKLMGASLTDADNR
jgi:hypothetical protein